MVKERNALKAGTFMVVAVVLVGIVVIGIEGVARFTQKSQRQTVRFTLGDDIGGLKAGDEVRAGGYKIGQITSIDLVDLDASASGKEPGVIITYSIPEKYAVHQNAYLGVQTTVTGQSCLNFRTFGTGTPIARGESLGGKPSTITQLFNDLADSGPLLKTALAEAQGAMSDVRNKTVPLLNQTLGKYGDTADTFTATGKNTQQLTGDLREKLPFIIAKYVTVTDAAVQMLNNTSAFFGDTTPDFRGTLANLNKITAPIKDAMPRMLERLDGILIKVDTTMQSASAAMEDIKAISTNAREVSASARSILSGNRGKIDSMIASLKAAGDNLKNATAEIRRSPWRLLYKPAPNEMANLNLFDAARAFADGANELNDASTSLRDAVQSKQVDTATLQKLMDRVDQSFNSFQDVQKKLYQQVRE